MHLKDVENIVNFCLDVEHIANFSLASFCLRPEDVEHIANFCAQRTWSTLPISAWPTCKAHWQLPSGHLQPAAGGCGGYQQLKDEEHIDKPNLGTFCLQPENVRLSAAGGHRALCSLESGQLLPAPERHGAHGQVQLLPMRQAVAAWRVGSSQRAGERGQLAGERQQAGEQQWARKWERVGERQQAGEALLSSLEVSFKVLIKEYR